MAKTSSKFGTTLPAPTLAQKLASMSEIQLADAARELAKDPSKDALCTAVLDELEKRTRGGAGFEAFVAELFPVEVA